MFNSFDPYNHPMQYNFYYSLHFIDEETKAQRDEGMPKVTQLVRLSQNSNQGRLAFDCMLYWLLIQGTAINHLLYARCCTLGHEDER